MNGPLKFAAPTRRVLLVGAASGALLGACGSLLGPSNPPAQIYVLAPDFRAASEGGKVPWGISISRPESSQTLNSERIAIRRGETLDYFADAQWPDIAPAVLQSLLVEAFEKSGRIKEVGKDEEALRVDYVMESELRAFEARYDDSSGAPTVVVDLMVKLLVARNRQVVALHDSRQESKAAANSVAATVAAFDTATALVLDDIVPWTFGAARGG